MSYTEEVIETTTQQEQQSGWFATLKEAVRGSNRNFTEVSIGRAIVLLSIPMILEMMMESLFGIVDVFFVARLGADAVAAVGLTESMLTIVFTVAMGLSMAVTAVVARRIGEKDPEGASVVAAQAIFIAVIIALPIALIGIFYTPTLFRLMGASESVIATGGGFGQIILGANVIIMLLFMLNAVFRGAGDAAIAMRVLWIANIINIVLCPCFIFGFGPFPELGVMGSAVATSIGRGTGVLIQLYVLFSGKGRIHVGWKQMRLNFEVMIRLLRLSLGGMFQFLVAMASWIALVRIVSSFGANAVAGYTIAVRIIIFSLLPSWGMCNAAATLVGQNLGAGKPERAEKSVWKVGLINLIFLTGVGIIFFVFAESLIKIFTNDAEVIAYGVDCLRYVSYGYLFYGYGMVVVQAFNGAGDTYTPTMINLLCHWVIQIPIAYWLAMVAGFGPKGVFIAIAVAESAVAVVGILMFRRGKWKERKV